MPLRIALACDHGGFDLKVKLLKKLSQKGYDVIDLGTVSADAVDYADKAHLLAETILNGEADRGILICGTGIGISIAANRHKGIRAALCTDTLMAKLSREHNDANVICFGGRIVGPLLAEEMLNTFLTTDFDGGRHQRRIDKIEIP